MAASARTLRLFSPGDHLLVALSGGPDSVALLTVLASLAVPLRLRLSALHVNYGLRSEESEEDARFVAGLCHDLNVPLVCQRVDLSRTAKRSGGTSLQARAREARYAALRRTAAVVGAGKIALGHTADDQAETLIMWMLRGTGASGLAGIRPMRDGMYIRPLFDVSRTDVLSYLNAKGRAFRTDSSNAKPVYLRNRIRHELMPLLKQFNPSLLDTLKRQAAIVHDEDMCFERSVSEWTRRHVVPGEGSSLIMPCAALLKLPIALQRRVVRRAVQWVTGSSQGAAFGVIEEILKKIVHGRVGLLLAIRGARVVREQGQVRFVPGHGVTGDARRAGGAGRERAVEVDVRIPSVTVWPPTGQIVRFALADDRPAGAPAGRHVAKFDADRFTHGLILRSWKAGDAFRPYGMGGRRKKLQDYFSDILLPREQRGRVPLLVAPEGILWVVGHRTDHRFSVTAATRRILTVEVGPVEMGMEDRS